MEFAMQMTATKVASDQMFLSKDKVQSSMMNFISHFDHWSGNFKGQYVWIHQTSLIGVWLQYAEAHGVMWVNPEVPFNPK